MATSTDSSAGGKSSSHAISADDQTTLKSAYDDLFAARPNIIRWIEALELKPPESVIYADALITGLMTYLHSTARDQNFPRQSGGGNLFDSYARRDLVSGLTLAVGNFVNSQNAGAPISGGTGPQTGGGLASKPGGDPSGPKKEDAKH